jgi:serine protease Do
MKTPLFCTRRSLWMALPLVSLLSLLLAPWPGRGETVKDREGAVRGDREKMAGDDRWIYNDVDRGFAEARESGKPLLVVLRCVPCKSCMGIDAGILEARDLEPLLDEFVCVRVINANALDLSRFQFDYDLSLTTLFFNGDGTVYGRFGSWTHQRDSEDRSTAGFRASMEAALAIHRGYPANRALLAGKQGGPAPFKVPVEIPALAAKYGRELDWQGNVVKSCVHCHQIGDAFRAYYRDQGKPIPTDLIYPMPMPETIGLSLAGDRVARVAAVAAESVAAAAGLLAGDDILSLDGQPLVAAADLAWVLHRAPESATLEAVVARGDSQRRLTLLLPAGWRQQSDISRRAGTWPMRAMAGGGLKLEDLPAEERRKRGLSDDQLALLVVNVGQYGAHAAAKRNGFQKDDVLIEVEGIAGRHTESAFIGALLGRYPGPAQVPAAVWRQGKRVELKLPMQ